MLFWFVGVSSSSSRREVPMPQTTPKPCIVSVRRPIDLALCSNSFVRPSSDRKKHKAPSRADAKLILRRIQCSGAREEPNPVRAKILIPQNPNRTVHYHTGTFVIQTQVSPVIVCCHKPRNTRRDV